MRFLNLSKEPENIDMRFVEARKGRFAELCAKNGLVLFYVYGSLARNKMSSLSDVDVAVLKDSGKLGLQEYSNVLAGLQQIFGREDIDLADLSEAPPVLKSRILRDGNLLYAQDEKYLAKRGLFDDGFLSRLSN